MPKHKKIWKSEDQILKKIDSNQRFAERKGKLAEEHKEKAEALAIEAQAFEDMGNHGRAEFKRRQCGEELQKSAFCLKLRKRTLEKTLPRLGEILSAYQTGTLIEVMGDYKGVVVR